MTVRSNDSTQSLDGTKRSTCDTCGWPIWPGQPVRTVADEVYVHAYCRAGVPDDINPRSVDTGTDHPTEGSDDE
jgi:RNase P subunit RPR2